MKFLPIFAVTILLGISVDAISNSQDSETYESPYIVSLNPDANSEHICAGSIIAKEWIVTAAHCATKPIGMIAIAGLYSRKLLEVKTQQRTVDFGVNHELYVHGQYVYDIALLHVSKPFVYTRFIQPAVLPARAEHAQGAVKLYGWGKTKSVNMLGAPYVLKSVDTELIDWKTCRTLLPDGYVVDERMVCSSSMDLRISVCKGDDGGPLAKKVDGMRTQELIGIVSWGMLPCGEGDYPSVYTEVSQYIDWISTTMSTYYSLY